MSLVRRASTICIFKSPLVAILSIRYFISKLLKDRKQDQLAIDHKTIVDTIKETILNGIDHRTALAKEVHKNTGDYMKTIYVVLDDLKGKLWTETRGSGYSKIYSII